MEQVEYFIEVSGPQTNVSTIDIVEEVIGIPDAALSAYVYQGAVLWNSVYSSVSSLSSFWNSVYSYVNSTSSIELNQEQVTAFVLSNSANIVSVDSLVNLTSAQWNSVYSYVNATSSIEYNQTAATTFVISNSSNILSVDSLVNSNSAHWNSAYTNLVTNSASYLTAVDLSFLSVSANWNSVYVFVNSTSSIEANQEAATTFVITNSANLLAVDSFVSSNSSQWFYQGTDLKSLSANWQSTYTQVNTNSAHWSDAYTNLLQNSALYLEDIDFDPTLLQATSALWDSVYSTVNQNSSVTWNYQGTDLKALSANWQAAYTNLVTNSAFYLTGVDLSFLSVSSHWDTAYSNLVTNSAAYLTSVDLSFLSVSSNWNSVYAFVNSTSSIEYNQTSATTFVLNNSANILAVNSLVNTTSSDWNAAYSNLITNSAAYLTSVDLSFLSVSANWDSVYTTVQSNSSLWDYQGTDLKSLSAHWQESYTNLVTNSAFYLTGVDLSLIQSASANWNTAYSYVITNSSIEINQQSATTFVLNNSANILSVDTLVNTNSAHWDLAYTTSNTLSTQMIAVSAAAITSYNTSVALASTVDAIKYLSSSKLISGGDIFQVNSNTVGISAGAASFYDSVTQTSHIVSWNAVPSYSLINVLSGNNFTTNILVSSNGSITTTQEYPIGKYVRDTLPIGRVDRTIANVIAGIYSPKYYGEEACTNILELTEAIGPINIQGNRYLPATGLTMRKTSGQSYSYMSSGIIDRKQPNYTDSIASNPATFYYARRNPSDGLFFESATTTLNPSAYDDGSGTLSIAYGKFIVQRAYLFPTTNITIVCHSQDRFDTIQDAQRYISSGVFAATTSFFRNAIHRCDIILDTSCTDVTDTSKAQFINSPKWVDGVEFSGSETVILDNILPGVSQIKPYISVVDNSHLAVTGGRAYIRKSDDTIHEVRWNPTASLSISAVSLSNPVLSANDMRWCVYKWDNESLGTIKLDLMSYLPPTLPTFERVALLGKVRYDRGTLSVNNQTICVSEDIYASRSEDWITPSKNLTVTAAVSLSSDPQGYRDYLSTSSGEMFRFPGVADAQGRHIFPTVGIPTISYMRGHLQGQLRYDSMINTLPYANTNNIIYAQQIKSISNWYDVAGTPTRYTGNNWATHRLGLFAGSDQVVWLRAQYTYGNLLAAQNGWQNENFVLSPWASDLSQFNIIAIVILKANIHDFTVAADCSIIDVKGGTSTIAGGNISTWGGILGTLSNQTDLQLELDARPTADVIAATYCTKSMALAYAIAL